jgi:hypothetical protein
MERKIASPRAIVVKTQEVNKNFSIKTKLTLGPVGGSNASVGVMFLVQSSGRGGFIFEINKKKSFRITDLGTSAFITKEGKNGWIKSKVISPPSRSNTIELKSFRGKFDIYINGLYLYSFVNESYKKGKFGVYIGPNAAASLYYFNVYNLDIPGAEPEIDIEYLHTQINSLKTENDSLKTISLKARYGDNDEAAILAIKILEDQLRTINEENLHLKTILKDYEDSEPKLNLEDIENDKKQTSLLSEKMTQISVEKDSIIQSILPLKNKILKSDFERDSLRTINLKLVKKINFLEDHIKEVQVNIDEMILNKKEQTEVISQTTNQLEKEIDEVVIQKDSLYQEQKEVIVKTGQIESDNFDVQTNESEKEPSEPSVMAIAPKLPETLPMGSTAPPLELIEKDSTFDHTLDMDAAFGIDESVNTLPENSISNDTLINDSTSILKEDTNTVVKKITKTIEITKDSIIQKEQDTIEFTEPKIKVNLMPIREIKIEVKKAVKGNFKD